MLAFTTLMLTRARAADEPAPDNFTLQLWASPTGQGIARTIGPMTPEHCQKNLGVLKGAKYADVPPDMRLMTLQCATQGNLQWWFAAYNCTASGSHPVDKQPEYRLWLYSCYRAP